MNYGISKVFLESSKFYFRIFMFVDGFVIDFQEAVSFVYLKRYEFWYLKYYINVKVKIILRFLQIA